MRSPHDALGLAHGRLPFPFVCPLTHLLDIFRLGLIRPRGQPSHVATLDYRESSFLDNPLTPPAILREEVFVRVVGGVDSAPLVGAHDAGGAPTIDLESGSSDVQITHELARHAEAPLLTFSSTEGVFGGWVDHSAHARFESMMSRTGIFSGSWCCSSWYKPSGSINFARPSRTVQLPPGCGLVSQPLSQSGDTCRTVREQRLRSQAPKRFVYERAPGPDGYWWLQGQAEL